MKYITNLNQIGDFQKELRVSTLVSMDTETTGLDCFTDFLTLLQVQTLNETFIFNCESLGYNGIKYITELIKESNPICIFHNAKFDIKFIKNYTGIMLTNVYDTMIGEVLPQQGIIKNKFPSLEDLVFKYCGVQLDKTVRKQFYENYSGITQEMLIYAVEDVAYLDKIREIQMAEMVRTHQEKVLDLEMKLLPVVADMELNGIYLNERTWLEILDVNKGDKIVTSSELLDKIWEQVKLVFKGKSALDIFELLKVPVTTKRDKKLFAEVTDMDCVKSYFYGRFNLNSPKQMYALLLNVFGVEDLPTTNEKDLVSKKAEFPIIADILNYRGIQKAVSSFGENYLKHIHPVTGRIHTNLNQQVADTGRFSSSNPNAQNIKRESAYRKAFQAKPGYKLVCVDFSQQEYRLVGAITGEPVIIKAYQEGADMHTATASNVFKVPLNEVTKEQRNKAKSYNFALLYGANKYGLAYSLGCTIDEAEKIIKAFYDGYPKMQSVQKRIVAEVFKRKYSVTLLGRRRYFENRINFIDDKDLQKYRRKLEKEGFNHCVQGSGADVTKLSLCKMYYENPFGEDFKIILTVHDEIVCEVPEAIAEKVLEFMLKCMEEVEQPFLGDIPAKAEGKVSDVWEH